MKVRDLILLSGKTQFGVAYDLNITYHYLSRIKNRSISTLSRDLQLKIKLFCLVYELDFDSKIAELEEAKIRLQKRSMS